MKHTHCFSRLRANFWLLVSTIAALCLFFLPVKLTILLEGAIFLLVLISSFLWEPAESKEKNQVIPLLLAAVFAGIGFLTFFNAWSKSRVMATVATMVHLPVSVLAAAIGFVGAVASFYAFWRLARWIDRHIAQFLSVSKGSTLQNLRSNWYFVLSAGIFFWMESNHTELYQYGIPVAVLILAMVAGKIPPLWKCTLDTHPGIRVFSAVNALGICCSEWIVFQTNRQAAFGPLASPPSWMVLLAAASFPFVAVCVTLFWRWLWDQLKASSGLRSMTRREWILLGGMFLALVCLTIFAFTSSEAFYGTEFPYDLIYTSDSPILVQNNAYLSLSYEENDLRQPLFALFAAPFMGILSLISLMFSLSATANAIVMNCPQIALLLLTLVLLTEVLGLSGKQRIQFLLFGCVSYPFLLFTLMMEQYIIACFYLVLCLHLLHEKRDGRIALWGSGGTLLTSVILLPAFCASHPVKQFRSWLADLYDRAIEFVIILLAFCRADIILDVVYSLQKLSSFSENSLTWPERIYRFTQFIRSCIFAPPVDSLHNANDILSWQLIPAAGMDWIGVAILVLCIVSAAMNRKKYSTRVAALWMGFSVVILLILGWGAPENGQILYSLYFGWAFVVLLYQLADRIGSLCKKPVLSTVLTSILILLMASVNLPAIWEMIRFATAVFPL